jgi:hypothetical protein
VWSLKFILTERKITKEENIVQDLAVTKPVQKILSGRVIGDTKEDFLSSARPAKRHFM